VPSRQRLVREICVYKRVLLGAGYLGITIDVSRTDVQESMKSGSLLNRGEQVLCADDIGIEVGLLWRPIGGAGCAVEDVRDMLDCLSKGGAIRQVAANDANRGRGEMAQV
jgi:hypothetical protein